ncbi:MAG TPA: hypothetical protein VF104_07790 [Burkholderiales bacterium]
MSEKRLPRFARFARRVLPVLAVLAAGLAAPSVWAADGKSLAVTAVVLSRSNCHFNSNATATLDF